MFIFIEISPVVIIGVLALVLFGVHITAGAMIAIAGIAGATVAVTFGIVATMHAAIPLIRRRESLGWTYQAEPLPVKDAPLPSATQSIYRPEIESPQKGRTEVHYHFNLSPAEMADVLHSVKDNYG